MTKLWRWLLIAGGTAILLEALLRLTLTPSQLYSRLHTVPAWNEWRSQVRFWEKHQDIPASELASSIEFDPQLGWDFDQSGDRIRGDAVVASMPQPNKTRIIALGDSYVFGTDLAAADNFSAILNAHYPNVEALNMGIPGYGIDQAVLKYEHYGQVLAPQLIVFGIYLTDYERSSVGFTFAPKPRFELRDNTLVLAQAELPAPEQVRKETAARLQHQSYLVAALGNLGRKVRQTNQADNEYFDHTDELVGAILQRLVSNLSAQQRLLIVHIPAAEIYAEPSKYRQQLHRRLLAIYQRLNLEYIDLAAEFRSQLPPGAVLEQYYVKRSNGSIGHMNRAAHEEIARLIADRL